MNSKYPIVEIFASIQGEGCNLGKPAVFIRFAGCNLKCPWCDTDWSTTKEGFLDLDEIVDRVKRIARGPLVVLTGGEPLIQHNVFELIKQLKLLGFLVAIETNGTIPTQEIKNMIPGVWVTCSPKPEREWLPVSGCVFDEIKYVVDGKLTAMHIQPTDKTVWLQPEGGEMQLRWKEALKMQQALKEEYPYMDVRIGVQLHKLMEVR